MHGFYHSAALLRLSGGWWKHIGTLKTFPLLDVPEGELILRETVAINEIGMTVEWEGKRKKGREQMGDTNEVWRAEHDRMLPAKFHQPTLPPLSSTCPRDPESEVGYFREKGLQGSRWIKKSKKYFNNYSSSSAHFIIITLQFSDKGNILSFRLCVSLSLSASQSFVPCTL